MKDVKQVVALSVLRLLTVPVGRGQAPQAPSLIGSVFQLERPRTSCNLLTSTEPVHSLLIAASHSQ